MSCAGCVRSVEKILLSDKAALGASVDLLGSEAVLEIDARENPDTVKRRLISSLDKKGYQASGTGDETGQEEPVSSRALWGQPLLLMALVLTLPLMGQMLLPLFGYHAGIPPLLQLLMVAPVQFLAGARFYRGFWQSLKAGTATMDTLVAIGTTAAFVLSLGIMIQDVSFRGTEALWSVHLAHNLYFETSAVVILLVLVGKIMEERAKNETNQAIQALLALRPATALVRRDGQERKIRASEIRQTDRVIVAAGQSIPCDGIIVQGESAVDESLVTGESLPVTRKVGDTVIGGTLNQNNMLELDPASLGEDSFLSKIVAQVKEAQQSKPPIQKLVDRVAALFVPAVLGVALLTFGGWWLWTGAFVEGIVPAISVLVIACPCALGLATPTALRVGIGMAARHGILFRDASVIEALQGISLVAFDKTGTLTKGKPVVVRTWKNEACFDDPDNQLVRVLFSALGGSTHPLSSAIRAFEQPSEPAHVFYQSSEEAGSGLKIVVEGMGTLLAGSLEMVENQPEDFRPEADMSWVREMTSVVVTFVPLDSGSQTLVALYGFEDEAREDARETVSMLASLGLGTAVLSGDRESSVWRLAERLNIQEVYAQQKPDQKLSVIKALQASGKKVAMVGDGMNDAPALAAADVGIAVGGGTDAAIKAAPVSLLSDRVSQTVQIFLSGRLIYSKIRHNLFGAFIYNCLGIPLAAFGILSPTLAGVAMAFSSVTVVVSSLLLYPSLQKCFEQYQPSRQSTGEDQ